MEFRAQPAPQTASLFGRTLGIEGIETFEDRLVESALAVCPVS